jgi:diketogulonate reductase-like aldo/keto reductase
MAIPSTNQVSHLEENAAAQIELSDDEFQQLDKATVLAFYDFLGQVK